MLRAIPPKSAALPKVRMSQRLLDALHSQAAVAGISTGEAVRQILEIYLANPMPLTKGVAGQPGAVLSPTRASAGLVASVRKQARAQGVVVAELIRSVLQDGLEARA